MYLDRLFVFNGTGICIIVDFTLKCPDHPVDERGTRYG